MSIAARKKTETAPVPVSLEQQLAEAKATVARLQKLETEIASEAAHAYATGAQTETPDKHTIRSAAELLLAGVDVFDAPDPPRNRTLILDERLAAIREAVRIALHRLNQLMVARESEVDEQFLAVWREQLRKFGALLDGMLELAKENHALIERCTERTGFRPRPIGDWEIIQMFGLGDASDPCRVVSDTLCGRLLDAMRRAGVR